MRISTLHHKLRVVICLVTFMICGGHMMAQINAEQMIRVGQNALYFEDYMLSIQYFNQAITAKPYMAQPYFMRAIAKLNLDDYLGAEKDASMAIDLNPFIVDAYEVRGVARQNRGDYSGAVSDYNNALALHPKSRGLLFNKALAQLDLEDVDSALITFNELLGAYPHFENGYLGRAKLLLEQQDTIGALQDIDKALSINKNLVNAYLLRAGIGMAPGGNAELALADISETIRLQPQESGYYVNRAYIRYNLDDYFGAMADYDYAVQLDPTSIEALFNRALLRTQTRDFDNAIVDYSQVLQFDSEDYRARYNRAIIYSELHKIPEAMSDINVIIDRFPELPEALYLRSNLYRLSGDLKSAERDYNKALDIARSLPSQSDQQEGELLSENSLSDKAGLNAKNPRKDTQDTDKLEESVAKKFAALRTVDTSISVGEYYNNKNIRGRVQDQSQRIELEPLFTLNYYDSPTELRRSTYFYKDVDEINATKALPFVVVVTNMSPTLEDKARIDKHFGSIADFTSHIAAGNAPTIDYIGRAMDHFVLRDYKQAIADLNFALAQAPDFAMGYFQRANARYLLGLTGDNDASLAQVELKAVISDYDKAIELSPRFPYAYFNKGNIYATLGDFTSALLCYAKAIECKEDFGEAYYNSAFVYFQLGNRDKGAENLSRAGELGIVPSYNLMKKMR